MAALVLGGVLLASVAACGQTKDDVDQAVAPLLARITALEQDLAEATQAGGGLSGESIQTRRLEIVDDTGAARIVLSTEGQRPSVALADGAGQIRAWLFLRDDGTPNLILINRPRFILMDHNGEIRALHSLNGTGAPVLSHVDAQGEVRATLRLDADGNATIDLFDATGVESFTAP
ncbi:MAG: hypothetical protein FJ317_06605 [SAR202 cluster bacterium]|nr:hypothetical protein [SAR202 cluster bacterium]